MYDSLDREREKQLLTIISGEWKNEKVGINETIGGYLYNATSMFCPTRFLSLLHDTTTLQVRVYPDTTPLGNIVFPSSSIGPFAYLVYSMCTKQES